MLNSKLRPVPSSIDGVGYYSKNDYHVLFETIPRQESKFVYHIGTLTICMDNNMYLVSLEAYTNNEKWPRVNLIAPETRLQGNIQLIANYDENRTASSDRNVNLEYSYDVKKSILRISVAQSDAVPEETIQVGDNMLIQIGPSQELLHVWFTDLQIR